MKYLCRVLLLLSLTSPFTAQAEGQIQLASPNGQTVATVKVSGGQLTYALQRNSKPVLGDSLLGINVGGVELGSGVTLGAVTSRTIDETYEYLGSRCQVRNHAIEYTISVNHIASGRSYDLQVRAYDEGMAYRYVVEGQGTQEVFSEAGSWELPDSATTYYAPHSLNYESSYRSSLTSPIASGTTVGGPITFRLADGSYAAISEAGVYGYPGMSFQATGDNGFTARFHGKQLRRDLESPDKVDPSLLPDDRWRIEGNIATPWRVTLTGDSLGDLTESHIIQSLNPAPEPTIDRSYVQPGRVAWSWWAHGNLDGSTDRLELEKRYITQASELGFEYVLLDDGWRNFSDAEVTELVDHAADNNMGVWVWDFYAGADNGVANGENWPWGSSASRDRFYSDLKDKGIVGVKLDFIDSEALSAINWYEGNLADAERYGILLNIHGANKATGESRRFPGFLTEEGIRGLEHNRSGGSHNLTHMVLAPFTRMLGGPMDFTPVNLDPAKIAGSNTTFAGQLATAVLYISPAQHWADDPAHYLASGASDVIAAMPTVWDESHVLDNTELGITAGFARRRGGDWFVGFLNAGDPLSELALDTDWLGQARAYRLVLLSDVAADRAELDRVDAIHDPRDPLQVQLVRSGGGVVAWLQPLHFGDADGDGLVGQADLDRLIASLQAGSPGWTDARWTDADFNLDGRVDFADYVILSQNYGQGTLPDYANLIPEPSAALLLTIGTLALRWCRR